MVTKYSLHYTAVGYCCGNITFPAQDVSLLLQSVTVSGIFTHKQLDLYMSYNFNWSESQPELLNLFCSILHWYCTLCVQWHQRSSSGRSDLVCVASLADYRHNGGAHNVKQKTVPYHSVRGDRFYRSVCSGGGRADVFRGSRRVVTMGCSRTEPRPTGKNTHSGSWRSVYVVDAVHLSLTTTF